MAADGAAVSRAEAGADPAMQLVPEVAHAVFGAQLAVAIRYGQLLTGPGIERGLVGPREAGRIWDRHLLNCAPLTALLPAGARVVDVGSGAGLPGLVLAIRRTDLYVDLVESLRRRTDFLTELVAELGLADRVRVVRGRAEDPVVVDTVGQSEWVTARALAPLDRLVQWCLPLLRPGGYLLAMKGERAASELVEHATAVRRHGGAAARLVRCPLVDSTAGPGRFPGDDATTSVLVVRRAAGPAQNRRRA